MSDFKLPTWDRRKFLDFLGKGAIAAGAAPIVGTISGCDPSMSNKQVTPAAVSKEFPFKVFGPSLKDDLILAEGLQYDVIAKWGDPINASETFGFNCDFTQFVPLEGKEDEGLLWVNHEYTSQLFVSKYAADGRAKTKAQVEEEMRSVGGSFIKVRRKPGTNSWEMVANDPLNRRLDGLTEIPIISERPIAGSEMALGTFANCSGGFTPWGNILTCEENYDGYYGERDFNSADPKAKILEGFLGWSQYYDKSPEHYGWVVEINPLTGEAKKLTGIGRCAHECAIVVEAADGRCVVYTGDDAVDEHFYKFISDEPGNLHKGKLYVASLEKGRWMSLNYDEVPALQAAFKDQTEILIRAREAAKIVGATPLDRPEDIEIDPHTGAVLVACTNNVPKGNFFGHIMKLVEKDNNPLAMEFTSEIFLAGGEELGFACPDNLAFDKTGNLWFTSDISGSVIGVDPYIPFGNNSLFMVPRTGENAGKPIRVASAPVDAELTGPCFSPDGKTLFLSVQHPGEGSLSMNALTSHWPDGGESIPKPTVVAVYGAALDALVAMG